MRNFSNTYIFVFSLIMVTIVAVLLSFVSTQLKPLQMMNMEIEKKQDILRSVGKAEQVSEVDNKNTYIEEEFGKYISESYVVDFDGKQLDEDAFEITLNLNVEIRKPQEERNYPVFIYTENGERNYVIPVRGKGLWGPVWGYVALGSDLNTISRSRVRPPGRNSGFGSRNQYRLVPGTLYREDYL